METERKNILYEYCNKTVLQQSLKVKLNLPHPFKEQDTKTAVLSHRITVHGRALHFSPGPMGPDIFYAPRAGLRTIFT